MHELSTRQQIYNGLSVILKEYSDWTHIEDTRRIFNRFSQYHKYFFDIFEEVFKNFSAMSAAVSLDTSYLNVPSSFVILGFSFWLAYEIEKYGDIDCKMDIDLKLTSETAIFNEAIELSQKYIVPILLAFSFNAIGNMIRSMRTNYNNMDTIQRSGNEKEKICFYSGIWLGILNAQYKGIEIQLAEVISEDGLI